MQLHYILHVSCLRFIPHVSILHNFDFMQLLHNTYVYNYIVDDFLLPILCLILVQLKRHKRK